MYHLAHSEMATRQLTQYQQSHGIHFLAPVGLDELNDVCIQLIGLAARWWDIGIGIGVTHQELETIRHNHRDASERLSYTLSAWIQNCENHTWDCLLQSLKNIGFRNVARKIQKRYGFTVEDLTNKLQRDRANHATKCSKLYEKEKLLINKIRKILKIRKFFNSIEELLGEIDHHIKKNRSLTIEDIQQLVDAIKSCSEIYDNLSTTCIDRIENLKTDLRICFKFRRQLIVIKQSLAKKLLKLSNLEEEIKLQTDSSDFPNLLDRMQELKSEIKEVKLQIETCIDSLHRANSCYQSLSDSLNECEGELEISLRKCKLLKNISISSKALTKPLRIPSALLTMAAGYILFLGFQAYMELLQYVSGYFVMMLVVNSGLVCLIHSAVQQARQISTSRVYKKSIKRAVSISAKFLSLVMGFFLVVDPLSILINLVISVFVGLRPVISMSHRSFVLIVVVYLMTLFVSSLFYGYEIQISFGLKLGIAALFGIVTIIPMFHHDIMRIDQLRDSIHYDILLVLMGAIAGWTSGLANDEIGAALRTVVIAGISLGAILVILWFEKEVFFRCSENEDLCDVIEILTDKDGVLEAVKNEIRVLKFELLEMERSYGSTYSLHSEQSVLSIGQD